jgi:hypothetical protein
VQLPPLRRLAPAYSASRSKAAEKTRVWMFIENIQELVDEVVSILFNLVVLSYRQ